uniref:Uncharacterized protein n=1 Tax=Sphaerodactylus townsendi TaxID=933632 RepID=A0ACB8FCI3_9SAUR
MVWKTFLLGLNIYCYIERRNVPFPPPSHSCSPTDCRLVHLSEQLLNETSLGSDGINHTACLSLIFPLSHSPCFHCWREPLPLQSNDEKPTATRHNYCCILLSVCRWAAFGAVLSGSCQFEYRITLMWKDFLQKICHIREQIV